MDHNSNASSFARGKVKRYDVVWYPEILAGFILFGIFKLYAVVKMHKKSLLTGNYIEKNGHRNTLRKALKVGKSPEEEVGKIWKCPGATKPNPVWRLQHHHTLPGFDCITLNLLLPGLVPKFMFLIFWDILLVEEIFLSPQVKGNMVISKKLERLKT